MTRVQIDKAPEGDAAALTFRCATLVDVDRIVTLVVSAYGSRSEASRRVWANEAGLLDGRRTDHASVRALIEASQSLIVLAERAGEIIACAHIKQRGELCNFGMFSVCPELQGAGVGSAVLSECERFARDSWGSRTITMTVIRQRDDLIAWYERRGYRRTGEPRPFPYGDESLRPRHPDLEFIVLEMPLRAGDRAEVMAGPSGAIAEVSLAARRSHETWDRRDSVHSR
jgi:GNAT superfamily N-acetyltransferase